MKKYDTTFENLALADEAAEFIRRSGTAQIKDLTETLQVKRRRIIRVMEADPRFVRGENGSWSIRTKKKSVAAV